MRRRIQYRVCSCTPTKGIVQIEARILVRMVNREMRTLKHWRDVRRIAHRGMNLGEVCFNSGHPQWAMKAWNYTRILVETYDFWEWAHAWWNDRWYNLDNLTAEPEATELGHCADKVWQWLGHPEMMRYKHDAKCSFDYLYYEHYRYDREELEQEEREDEEAAKPDTSIQIFNDGLPYWKPLFTQYIYTLYDK